MHELASKKREFERHGRRKLFIDRLAFFLTNNSLKTNNFKNFNITAEIQKNAFTRFLWKVTFQTFWYFHWI